MGSSWIDSGEENMAKAVEKEGNKGRRGQGHIHGLGVAENLGSVSVHRLTAKSETLEEIFKLQTNNKHMSVVKPMQWY